MAAEVLGDFTAGFIGAARLLLGGDPETWITIRQSLAISLGATALSLAIGIPLGSLAALGRFRGRRLLLALFQTGFGLPPVVVGLVLSLLLLRHGPLGAWGLRFTPAAVIVAQTLLAAPIVASLVASALESLPPRLPLLLTSLGAGRSQQAWLLLREIRGSLAVATMAAFGAAISEVGATMLVGGNLPGTTRTLTSAVVMETGMGHYDRALAHGAILLGLVAAVACIAVRIGRRP